MVNARVRRQVKDEARESPVRVLEPSPLERITEGPDEGSSGSESSSGWNDLVGRIEEQGEEDTQGFLAKAR